MKRLEIIGVTGLPEFKEGDDIVEEILKCLSTQSIELTNKSVLVIAQKIVSKVEGQMRKILNEEDFNSLVSSESQKIIRKRGKTIIAQTKHGFICANVGIDRSNIEKGFALLLPENPDESAKKIRRHIERELDIEVGVIISDTFGRAWRNGQINVAIGISGIEPLKSYVGEKDSFDNELNITQIAIADELSSAAELVMGKTENIPIAIISNYEFTRSEKRIEEMIRKESEDYFL
jgi:coenzyme F420-0:L-glutamate ligase/coenzyme F420-1:gamma-L-glutamate ligase